MAGALQIANWALILLGEPLLSSAPAASHEVANGEIIDAMWEPTRDGLLTSSAWRFAIARASLTMDADAPEWGFDYQYTIDGNVVRVLQVSEFYPGLDLSDLRVSDESLYRIEQGKILTNLGDPLYVKWIVNDIAVGLWHPAFARLMAANLAETMNPRISGDESKAARLLAWRREAWALAASSNAIEDPPEHPADDSWMAAHAS